MLTGASAAIEAFIYALYGLFTIIPWVLAVRLFVYDGHMIGMHKATWFLGLTYVLGAITGTITSISRGLSFTYVVSATGTLTTLERNFWITSVAFGFFNSLALVIWHMIARRISINYAKPAKKDGSPAGTGIANILVNDWKGTIALAAAALCGLVEWIFLGIVSFGTTYRILPSGIPFYMNIPYITWHLIAVGGFAYFINADLKRKNRKDVY